MSLSFTNAITQCNKLNLSNNTCSYIAIDYRIVSFTSNNSIITCMGTQVTFKKWIIRAKISTLPWNIHKSKLVKSIVADARFSKTWWSMVFLTMVGNTFSTRKAWEKNKTWRHLCNINFRSLPNIRASGQGHVTLQIYNTKSSKKCFGCSSVFFKDLW